MHILIASDKFKGSLTAQEVCSLIASEIHATKPGASCTQLPLADGGDGSLAIIEGYMETERITIPTVDPIGRQIEASYLIAEQTAYVELAEASGLVRLAEAERNPLHTDTVGTGILIQDALARGITDVVLFAGGSSTNEAGLGIATALGYQLWDQNGRQVDPKGNFLPHIHRIAPPKDPLRLSLTVLCDVTNPMFGPNGAAHIYAAQKGASPAEIEYLDAGLAHLATVIRRDMQRDVRQIPGGGAAGAIGAGLAGTLGATIKPGFQTLSELVQLEVKLKAADMVISGEGKIDASTLQGKVVGGVAALCQKHHKPLYVFAGVNQLTDSDPTAHQVKRVFALMDIAQDQAEAMTYAASLLSKQAKMFAQTYI